MQDFLSVFTRLEQLKQLVLNSGYDEESRELLSNIENRLHKIAVAENVKQYPTIQEYIEHLTTEADRCTMLLDNDRTLTDLQRQVLFEKRDLCRKFLYLFGGEEQASIEEEINNLLDVAKNS
jgi:hypothetical protein